MDFKPQMPQMPPMEIPEPVRQMAERNVEQSRSAYMQFVDMAKRAQEMVAKSSGTMTQTALDIQTKALRFAEQNVEAGFSLASELARARDMKEYMEIQTKHAQRQMQAYANQAQELGRLMTEAAQKAQPKV
ncbi:MAG: phasin family protein [Hyphomicrobiaceae bacterium]